MSQSILHLIAGLSCGSMENRLTMTAGSTFAGKSWRWLEGSENIPKHDINRNLRDERDKNKVQIDTKPWGNPIDVPNDDIERYYFKQNGLEKEDNERATLVKSFNLPIKKQSNKSKKVMSMSTLRSTQQRRRRRRRRQLELNASTDCSLEGYYNFKENSSGLHSAYNTKTRKTANMIRTAMEEKKLNTLKAVQKSGIVNTKISVYEKNLGCAKDDNKQSIGSKRKKAVLGVPLVGMQNTSSMFPVHTTASSCTWKNPNSTEDPVQSNTANSKTTHSAKGVSTGARKDRTPTKRRAPSVPNIVGSEPISQVGRVTPALTKDDRSDKKSSRNSNVTYPTKFMKNPYSTARNGQLRIAKEFGHVRESARASSATVQQQSAFVSLRSSGGKRKTLYAKDADGEEAVRVLSNLCLNPLARNSKRASFMMWWFEFSLFACSLILVY